MKLPRLVFDTTILVAASRNRSGPSFALIQAVRSGLVRLCCSPALFLEYEEVMMRPEQRVASGWSPSDVTAVLDELAGMIEPITPHYRWRPQLRDPCDEMVLEVAVNARADALVTYNQRDFVPAAHFGLPVMLPMDVFHQFKLPRSGKGAPR